VTNHRRRAVPTVLAVILVVAGAAPSLCKGAWTLVSPDAALVVTVEPAADGRLTWRIDRNGAVALLPSPVGIVTERDDFGGPVEVVAVASTAGRDGYDLPLGKRTRRECPWNGLTLSLQSPGGGTCRIEFRAYDDGAAYRHTFAGEGRLRVERETGSFRLPPGRRAWLQPYQKPAFNGPAYERPYREASPDRPDDDLAVVCMPALFEVADDGWVLLAESDLDENYCGSRLRRSGPEGLWALSFPARLDGLGFGACRPTGTCPFSTPWRVVMAGSLADIVESTLIDDLARPLDPLFGGRYPSWVRPGRSAWDWAYSLDTGRPEQQRRVVDAAAALGWEYVLVDANWTWWNGDRPYGEVEKLCRYADERGVGIMLWYNSGGPHNVVFEHPRDLMHRPAVRQAEFAKIRALGVRGVKVDFFHSEKQNAIALHLGILEDAARAGLLVNFHGCTVPRGWQRRFPNLMTHEAVYGGEQYRFKGPKGCRAVENLYYVFTRNVVGPMDYTPVIFEPYMADRGPTYGHALAQAVMFESSLVHFADTVERPEAGYQSIFRRYPPVRDFLARVPATWDDTRLLSGHPATHAVLARRKGSAWFVAGFNGTEAPRTERVVFDMIDRPCRALLVGDGDGPHDLRTHEFTATPRSAVTVDQAPQGGFVLWIRPTTNASRRVRSDASPNLGTESPCNGT